MLKRMDINCDMGESFGNWQMGDDAGMMPFITTANVACGFHASDPVTMIGTVKLAQQHQIAVGAHPGLPDLLGFGRRAMNITPDDAYAYVVYQVGALQASLATQGMKLHHIKPHGAFYSVLKSQVDLAEAVAEAIQKLSDTPMLYWPAPTSAALPTACKQRGIRVVGEIYPDLQYASDGALVIQRHKHATDVEFAASQVQRYVETGKVQAMDGTLVELDAESLCIHGDGPNCVAVATAIQQRLRSIGCKIVPVMN
ncbi:MAG: LamB/YcsF family protein [Gammaproteobacteria bacterium]|nr:LamB/YcsF family protein [Gammaproteobacteria bacterium]